MPMISEPMPAGVAEIRADICADCPSPCAGQREDAWHANPCAACPLPHATYPRRWGTWGACAEAQAPEQGAGGKEQGAEPPLRGLGDVVALVAQPIARAIDDAFGTKIAGCGGCAKRQAALNRAIPFGRPPSDL